MALLSAQVLSDGTLVQGAGVTGATWLATGAYEVNFNRDVSHCFYSAVSYVNSYPIYVEPRSGDLNGVFIEFSDRTGTSNLDSRFYLTVFCAK
jgi:hypothetical protein